MSSTATCAAMVAPDRPLVSELVSAIGAEVVRIRPERLDAPTSATSWGGEAIVWMHMVPAGSRDGALGEAALLLRSADLAARVAAGAGKSLTFIALVPSRGLLDGALGHSCELAVGALEGLMRSRVGAWSVRGNRLLGIVYAGLSGHHVDGQRSSEDARRRTPIGSLGTVQQLGDAIRFLGSRHAAYVTGTIVHVDGGWNAYSWIYPARTI